MTAKCALCIALLKGDVLSQVDGFKKIGVTNISREIGRQIERTKERGKGNTGFGVTVSRVKIVTKSQYGVPIWYYEFRLNKAPHNKAGIKLMSEYVKKHSK